MSSSLISRARVDALPAQDVLGGGGMRGKRGGSSLDGMNFLPDAAAD